MAITHGVIGLGMIVRMDHSGLGYQSRALAYMLKPAKLMIINSTSFNKGAKQHPEWYDGFPDQVTIDGFPGNMHCARFLQGLSHVLTCETPYTFSLLTLARVRGVKTFVQHNWEFSDHLRTRNLPRPTQFLAPSYWKLEEMQQLFPNTIYLPPPTFPEEFVGARKRNLDRKGRRRFLHVVGKPAVHDRNGTESVIEALRHTSADFELVIRSQHELDIGTDDRRVRFDLTNHETQAELYEDFDALILPRRYGGLCLPMNEGLMSALPVVMTDVGPNNRILSSDWLIPASRTGSFMARTEIDIFQADTRTLAKKLDFFCSLSDEKMAAQKLDALEVGLQNYSPMVLQPKYEELLQ